MKTYVLTDAAEADLRDIIRYTLDRPEFHRHSSAASRVAPFELYRRDIASGTMPTNRVVEHLDVVEHVRGRGFTRILRDEQVLSPYLLRPIDPSLPRPMRFPSRQGAEGHARSVGLMPAQRTWQVREP